jgi:S1-C subfamily serine protease
VDAEGSILTKASQLGDELVCQLADGREFAAELIDVDRDMDLAMLRVDADHLHPIVWSTAELPTGSWLVTPGAGGRIESVGVVSVAARKIARTQPMLGVEIEKPIDGAPRLARVLDVIPRSGAAKAGVEDGDVIIKIRDTEVSDIDQVRKALQEFRTGDVVKATIQRGADTLELEVTLGGQEEMSFMMNGPLSPRRDDFPQAVQHDSTLSPALCGGPVVNSSGQAAGINIARASRIATLALPYDALAPFVNEHTTVRSEGAP